jgi:hypothetical protein
MLNAVWLVPLALWLASRSSDPENGPLDTLYFGLTALFWIGHRLASTWLAYATEAYRPLLRAEPVRFVWLPLAVTVACFAILLPADQALPWTRAERVVALAILDYGFVTWHFGQQHFGALSLYRNRAGRGADARRYDRLFALGVGAALVLVADVLAGAVAYQDVWVDRWLLPSWIAAMQEPIRLGATLALAAVTMAMLVSEVRAARLSWPRILYILGLAAMVAIALQPRSLFLFLVIWTAQHWILAAGLASQTPGGEPAPDKGGVVRHVLHTLNTRPWAILILVMVVSAALLPLFEVEANRQDGTFYGDRIFGLAAEALRSSIWVPGLLALGFATGFVHYIHDRNIYRLSDPKVREAAKGLIHAR